MLTSSDVEHQNFTPRQFREGYDEREVDEYLDRVRSALQYYEQGGRPGPQAPAVPERPAFTTTKLRRGYDQVEVDEFLNRVVEGLRYYEQGGRPPAQTSAARPKSEGLAQRATRWLRGDPRP